MEEKSQGIVIPYQELSPDALKGVIEEFITREGTDYGDYEYTFMEKYDQVLRLLKTGRAFICFDPDTESATLVTELPEEDV
jgi:uncharacterized protein